MKWILRVVLVLVILYVGFFATVLIAMKQPPVRFGAFMKYAPAPLVWGALPAQDMWLWARKGSLEPGEMAPDFTLPRQDHSGMVTLSEHRGHRPVVLVFGSYT
jgi:hypothetical protein